MFPETIKNHRPTALVEQIRSVEHSLALQRPTLRIELQHAAPRHIVMPIHRSGIVTMYPRAITRKRNEISQEPLPRGRGSARGRFGNIPRTTIFARFSEVEAVTRQSRKLKSKNATGGL
jgi:hypothetical protein